MNRRGLESFFAVMFHRFLIARRRTAAVCLLIAALSGGCGGEDTSLGQPAQKVVSRPVANAPREKPRAQRRSLPEATDTPREAAEKTSTAAPTVKPSPSPRRPTLPPIDDDRATAHGIRKLAGTRLTLYTDLPIDAEIERLPELFELAVPQWCDYFGVDEAKLADWRVRGCLMKKKARFEAGGLLPPELPQFANGFTRDNEIWWHEQSSPYYRQHLMLHEGTHSLMYFQFGSCGPPWYMEALAELLGTHRLDGDKLTLGYFPARTDEVPYWGRIKIVRDAVRSGSVLTIDEIMAYPLDAYLRNETYGWCWAIAAFLDGHLRYRARFRQLPGELRTDDFNRRLRSLYVDDWDELNIEWQAFIHELEYGYDLVRSAIDFHPDKPLPDASRSVTIAADRGWQSSGIRLSAGVEYELTATGRYQIADQPATWWCEPGGVTIRYFRGRPLGVLLAMVLPDGFVAGQTRWPEAIAIGPGRKLSPNEAGTLYLKINDSPAELADNAGTLKVTVENP